MRKIVFIGGGSAKFVGGIVRNHNLIENLPAHAVVEVPCMVDANGVQPCRVGRLPLPLAAAMSPHIAMHEMAVAGVFAKSRRQIIQAVQADPLTGAILSLPQINAMMAELWEANRDYLKGWK